MTQPPAEFQCACGLIVSGDEIERHALHFAQSLWKVRALVEFLWNDIQQLDDGERGCLISWADSNKLDQLVEAAAQELGLE